MSTGLKITLIVFLFLFVVGFIGLALFTRSLAVDMIQNPISERNEEGIWPPEKTPENFGMEYETVSTVTEDGLTLGGWYVPGVNGATVMIQHGSPGGRQDGLYEADILNKAGFTVLLGSFRAHDDSEGEKISYGYFEQADNKAWHHYLLSRADVDPERIGIFGESMGGGTGILYSAADPGIGAIATASAFGLTQEVVESFIWFETGLPKPIIPLLARFIVFWLELEANSDTKALDTEAVIAQISPVPIMIIHGGADDKIGPNIGRQLFEAAAEPKELVWIEEAGHVNFEEVQPEVYNEALINFFSQHLLD